SAHGAKEPRGEGYLDRLRGWAERVSGSDRNHLSPHRSAALHRASGAGFAELCALEAPQISGGRSAANLSCGHRGRSHATSGGGNSQVECVSQRESSMAAELGSHHAFFPLSRRHSQGDLYDQQRGGTASLAAQDHQNAGCFSPRGVSAEVAISGDPPGMQEVDHAGDQLEPSLELLHRPLARAHAQAGQVGIMHRSSFLRGEAREGEVPPSLATHPQKQLQPQKQSLVVYTEDWTQPPYRWLLHAATSYHLPRLRPGLLRQTQHNSSHPSPGQTPRSTRAQSHSPTLLQY